MTSATTLVIAVVVVYLVVLGIGFVVGRTNRHPSPWWLVVLVILPGVLSIGFYFAGGWPRAKTAPLRLKGY